MATLAKQRGISPDQGSILVETPNPVVLTRFSNPASIYISARSIILVPVRGFARLNPFSLEILAYAPKTTHMIP